MQEGESSPGFKGLHLEVVLLVAQMGDSACNVGDLSSIPGSGRSPGGEHGNALQYSCLESSMDIKP